MRAYGVTGSDVPNTSDHSSAHTIIDTVDDGGDKVTLTFRIGKIISYLDTEHPREWHVGCRWIILTSSDVWNPYSEFQKRRPELNLLRHGRITMQENLQLSELIQIPLRDALDASKL